MRGGVFWEGCLGVGAGCASNERGLHRMNELVLTQLCIACSFIRRSLCGPGFSFGVLHPVLFWLLEKDLGVCSGTALWGGIR